MDQRASMGGNYAAELQETEVYRQRRRRLAEALGEGTFVLWGAGDERGYGDVGTFRQEPGFFYLTGVELPNAVLVVRPKEATDALFLPPRHEGVERWTGPKWGPGEEAAAALGFDEVASTDASETVIDARRRPVPGFEGRLQGWLSEPGGLLWTVFPALPTSVELGPTHRFIARLRERVPSFEVHDASQALSGLRCLKDPGEVALMRKAIAATVEAQHRAARVIGPGVAEGTVDGAVYAAFREAGAEGAAFPSIVGSGFNATTLHYDHNRGVCGSGELVVVDIGARYGYYCGDITRTYPASGRFDETQRALYELVAEAHDRVADAIRPGVTINELRSIAYEVFQSSKLRDSRRELLGQHFIHGIGHFLGLEAHDPGSESAELEAGMVITNEPGLYIPHQRLGIRIEDDYLVTKDGAENLSAALPTSPDEIEAMMRG